MAFTFGSASDGRKTMAAGSPPAGACSASKTMSDVPSVLFNMRSRPEVSQFVRSTAETTAERRAVGLLTLRAGAVRGAMRCSAPANAGRSASTLILGGHKLRCKGLGASRSSDSALAFASVLHDASGFLDEERVFIDS